jgi:hypothetical protein
VTLADLRRALELLPSGSSLTMPRDELLAAIATETPAPPPRAPDPEEPEKWLTADECAALLHVSARWCYDHRVQLGGRKLSRRCVRFSSRAVDRYLRRRG